VQFNLCNEPWLKYTLSIIADKGMSPSLWTSARQRREVLYLETNRWALLGAGWESVRAGCSHAADVSVVWTCRALARAASASSWRAR
jgi:hypothetical protein